MMGAPVHLMTTRADVYAMTPSLGADGVPQYADTPKAQNLRCRVSRLVGQEGMRYGRENERYTADVYIEPYDVALGDKLRIAGTIRAAPREFLVLNADPAVSPATGDIDGVFVRLRCEETL